MLQRASVEGANSGRIREVKGVRNEFGVATIVDSCPCHCLSKGRPPSSNSEYPFSRFTPFLTTFRGLWLQPFFALRIYLYSATLHFEIVSIYYFL